MLSDRQYMREKENPVSPDAIVWLMGILAAVFVAEKVSLSSFIDSPFLFQHFPFSVDALRQGKFWTLITYNFVSDLSHLGGFINLAFNLAVLYFCGRALIERLGSRLFLMFYFGCILAGALAWSAGYALHIDWPLADPSVAGAGVFALFCCLFAEEQMTFLVFFILPVTLKPKHFVWIWAGLDLLGFLIYERIGVRSPIWNGHLARLVAMATGAAFYFIRERRLKYGSLLAHRPGVDLPRWLRKTPRAARPPSYRVNLNNRDDLRAEVDRILDKINSAGFNALTDDEKQVLDEAKDLLSRR